MEKTQGSVASITKKEKDIKDMMEVAKLIQ